MFAVCAASSAMLRDREHGVHADVCGMVTAWRHLHDGVPGVRPQAGAAPGEAADVVGQQLRRPRSRDSRQVTQQVPRRLEAQRPKCPHGIRGVACARQGLGCSSGESSSEHPAHPSSAAAAAAAGNPGAAAPGSLSLQHPPESMDTSADRADDHSVVSGCRGKR